jgi:hypothetical protein
MSITLELAPDIELQLQEQARRLGESVDVVASRLLAETLGAEPQARQRFEVNPLTLDVPENLDRARHESAQAANLPQLKRFVVKPIEGMRLPPEWTSGCVQELLDILDGPDAR